MPTTLRQPGAGTFWLAVLLIGVGSGVSAISRDLYHRFFENQMEIDGGKNDMFAA